MTYYDVLDKLLDTENTTVGGGSAAALSGAVGAGLIGMVALLSKGKDYGLPDTEYAALEQRCRELQQALLAGCVADTEAYSGIVAAYKLPKTTEKERAARKKAIAAAGMQAAATPRDNGRCCKAVYELGTRLAKGSNPNCGSDLHCGIDLAKLGIQGCIANIEANLPLIKDAAIMDGLQADIEALQQELV